MLIYALNIVAAVCSLVTLIAVPLGSYLLLRLYVRGHLAHQAAQQAQGDRS